MTINEAVRAALETLVEEIRIATNNADEWMPDPLQRAYDAARAALAQRSEPIEGDWRTAAIVYLRACATDRSIKYAGNPGMLSHADTIMRLAEELEVMQQASPYGLDCVAQRADEPVAWCSLTASGKIAYFDGKPIVMVGPVGNEHHKTPLYPAAPAYVPLTADDVWNSREIMAVNGARAGLLMSVLMDLVAAIESLVLARMKGTP